MTSGPKHRNFVVVKDDPRHTRREYGNGALHRRDLAAAPHVQFARWMQDAMAVCIDPTAMCLATAGADGQPAARIVLLKGHEEDAFTFFTDQSSQKGDELRVNPRVSLLFHWRELNRQVRINGLAEPVPRALAAAYFAERPAASRLSAAVSQQSMPVNNRAELEARVRQLREAYPDGDVPLPDRWGGYKVTALQYEFWQGREGRLHDRFRYRAIDGDWLIERLQP